METDKKALFAVFDGHGGREVAVYCKNHYLDILKREKDLIEKESEQEWLRQSFLKVDDDLKKDDSQNELGNLRRELPPKRPAIMNILQDSADKKKPEEQSNEEMMLDAIGCTSNVIFIDQDKKKIFVANAGDSRCTMAKNGAAIEMSIDHKPENQIEIDRIEKAGSVITDGRVDGNLNLTRSLGDLKHKQKTHLKPEEQAITANPDTYSFELEDNIDFIIMGCDGIWEKKSNEEMVEWIYAEIKKQTDAGTAEDEVDLQKIVNDLLNDTVAPDVASSGGVGCDNMTCILIKFNKNRGA